MLALGSFDTTLTPLREEEQEAYGGTAALAGGTADEGIAIGGEELWGKV